MLTIHRVLITAAILGAAAPALAQEPTSQRVTLDFDKAPLENVVQFYDKYFDTYSGKGFIEDLYSQFPDEDEQIVLEFLLAHGEQEVKSGAELVEQEPDSALPAETDEAFGKVGALEGQGGGGG